MPDSPISSEPSIFPSTDEPPPHLSLNALAGMPAPETFRIFGIVCGHRLIILVDGGSTHNFVQLRVARFLGLPSTLISPLPVMVGDGGVLHCTCRYPRVPITIQGHSFHPDLFGLQLSGADIVLGVQWLQELGPVTTDYNALSMDFLHLGLPVHLVADVPLTPPLPQPSK